MKQRITVEDLQQLTDDQKQKLQEWWKPAFGDVYLAHENTTHVSGGSYYSGEQTQIIDIADQLGRHHYKNRCIPLLSIGQMIELLRDKQDYFEIRSHSVGFVFYDELNNKDKVAELADTLWEAVKIVL